MSDLDSILADKVGDLTQRKATWLQLVLLQQMRKLQIDQVTVADEAGVDETALSRFINSRGGMKIADLEAVMNVLGLRVVAKDADTVTVTRAEWEATRMFARKALED